MTWLEDLVPAMQERAAQHDQDASFPAEDVAALAAHSLPTAPLPTAAGGQGMGTEPSAADAILTTLRTLGRANPSLGRLFEAHVNVVRLVHRFGTAAQRDRVARVCHAGRLFGLWVTDAPGRPLTLADNTLHGAKGPGSGAGHLHHALVTVHDGGAVRMALLDLSGHEPVTPFAAAMHGMRASANGTVDLEGTPLAATDLLGADGDYLREPDFSTGAWRTSAVTLGGMDALLAEVRAQLRRRRHEDLPLQQARFGEMLIALETAALWTKEAGHRAERADLPAADLVAYVNLARIAVETACLDLMRHAQRALGLAAMVRPNPVERIVRDLATLLRQPAPDLVLTEAARHALIHGLPP